MKDIQWHGDSIEAVRDFPRKARLTFGLDLNRLREGLRPLNCRPMKTVGRGVWELKAVAGNQFRVIYVDVRRGDIHVLHAFEKKTQKTSRQDIAIVTKRYKEIGN